jgi:predicted ATPase
VRLWEAASGRPVATLQGHTSAVGGVALSADGQLVASGGEDGTVRLWEISSGQPLATLQGHTGSVSAVALSADGQLVASGGTDGTVKLWEAASGQPVATLSGHTGAVRGVALSADGQLVASGGTDGTVKLWEAASGWLVATLSGHTGVVWGVALSADGRLVASGGEDGTVRLWEISSGQPLATLSGHTGGVFGIARGADGQLVASGSFDGTVKLWEAKSGACLRTLRAERRYERMDISGLIGITEAQRASLIALGAVERLLDHAPAVASAPLSDADQPARGDQKLASSLPSQSTSFVGRAAELAELARILGEPACRLLTLLGPGGIGKTRLALEVAATHTTAFADGVAFVALASVSTPFQIVSTIGDTLGLSFAGHSDPTAHLLGYLHERQMLLVLDNFEHLLAGADLLSAILERAPHITLVVTSRERLNLQAEWLFDVDGLAFPPEDPHGSAALQSLAELADYSAVQLFVQRARQVQPGLVLDEATLTAIIRICQHLAGMPLAIELAAVGVRSLSLSEIEHQIRANLDGLTTTLRDVPQRHRSMRAVFDRSWQLLSEGERALFSRLAVFRGGWTLAAAEHIARATLPTLTALVDKSLVRQDSAEPHSLAERARPNTEEEPRFAMLEPIREYALEQLAARGEIEAQQRAHASYYLALAEAAAAQWDTPTAEALIRQLDRENDNLRAALQWTRDGGDHTIGLRLAGALRKFWQSRGLISEGRAWLAALLARADMNVDAAGMVARLQATQAAAWLASNQHDFVQAGQLFEQSISLQRSLGETGGETQLLFNAALQARAMGQYQQAIRLLEETVTQHRARGDRGSFSAGGLGLALYWLGLMFREQGEFARAATLFEECVDLHRALGDRQGMAQALLALGDIACDQGNVAQMRRYAEQSLQVFRELGVQWTIGFALNNLALAAALEGDLAHAFNLIEEGVKLFRSLQADDCLAVVLITLGQIVRAQGDNVAAYGVLTEALRLALAVGRGLLVAAALEGLAGVVVGQGHAELAARLLAAASALRAQMGTPVRPVDQGTVEQALATARSILGAEAFAAVWAEAQSLPVEHILNGLPSVAVFTAVRDRSET